MNAKSRDEWVGALRSGKYKQGRGYLRYQDRYCCLGVLAEIQGLFISEPDEEGVYTVGGNRSLLPDTLIPLQVQNVLANMNDHGCSFDSISTYIEGGFTWK